MGRRKRVFCRPPAGKNRNPDNKKVSLKTYSLSVINSAQEARKKYQQNYRKEIQQLRAQLPDTPETEKEALNVFPEEIWHVILENINERNVLRKCLKAGPLFHRLVSTTQVLFEEVFPFLSGYFSKQDILACSHVCSKWRSGVESFLANYHCGIQETGKSRKLDSFQTELNFNDNRYLNPDVNVIPESALLLLPGGVVTISKFYQPSPLQMPKFEEWLDTNGERIKHVTLNMKQTSVNVQQLYMICSKLTEKCPNLESLYLSGGQFKKTSKKDRKPLPSKPLIFPCLEFLKVTTQCERLLEIQDLLLKSCSPQLKHLSVSCWNSESYNNLSWHKLQRLEILDGNAMHVLQSLEKLNVPNLKKLQVRLDSNCQDLAQLFRTINSFQHLQHLSLTLTENCTVWSDAELVKIPLELFTCKPISTLEIITKPQKPNRDFLVCFPLVRNLILRYGKAAARAAAFEEDTILDDSDVVEDFSKDESSEDEFKRRSNMMRFGRIARAPIGGSCCGVLPPGVIKPKPATRPPPKTKSAPAPKFVDMTMFGKTDNLKDFYKSNIWMVMPLLNKLELQCVYSQPKGYRGRRPSKRITRGFQLTRQGYTWEIEEREQRQEIHAEKVRKVARQQIRQQRDAIVKELAKPKVAPKRGPKATKLEKQLKMLVQENALPLVMKSLAKSDILTCRLVSKWWKSLADKQFLHEELLARDWIFRDKIMGDDQDYASSDSSSNSDDDKDKKPKQDSAKYFKENFDKPFFGRIMQAKLEDVSYCVDEYLIATLESLAEKIEDLSITSEHQMEPDDFYNICVAILRHCPNLRAASFNFAQIISSNCAHEDAKERYSKTIEAHHNLESITLLGPRQSRDLWNLSPDTIGLIEGYSNLLPQFAKFSNLKHLKFGASFTEKWIDMLEKMLEAPGLETMGLRLGGDFVTVEQLVKLVNKFPKLTSLDLEFYGKLGGLSNLGIVYTPTSSISTRITAMKVTMEKKEEVSLDVLIHFPFLRKLCITYGPWAAPWDKKDEYDNDSDFAVTSDSDMSEDEIGEKKMYVSFREPGKDYVQLAKYFGEKKPIKHDKKKILESNIWVVLEKLESLEVVCVLSENDKKHSTVFKRIEGEAQSKTERKVD